MGLEDFERKAVEVISKLREVGSKEIILVHHDDADGLSSGAIVKATLEREGFVTRVLCLEKLYLEVVEDLHKGQGKVIFYSDIGSAHSDFISDVNVGRNLTVVLDHHHNPPKATDPSVHDLNLEHYGFEGDTGFSGATCSYLFSKALDERNVDLSYLALVGSREIPGDYVGLNKRVLEEASRSEVVKVEGKRLKIAKLGISVDDLFAKLQVLGAAGYYLGGPEMGVQACIDGITSDTRKKALEWEERRKNANKRVLALLYRQRLKETDHLQWFDAGNLYAGMGTKVIGQFCSFLSYQARLVKPDKYILGFMNVPLEVPGWQRKLNGPLVKLSVRVPETLRKLIDNGKMLSAVDLLLRASEGFGVADGHKYAANVVIPAGRKEVVVENADSVARI